MLPRYIDKWANWRELVLEMKAIVFIFQLRDFLKSDRLESMDGRITKGIGDHFPEVVKSLDLFEQTFPSLVIFSKVNDWIVSVILTSPGRDKIEKYRHLWVPALKRGIDVETT